MCRVGACALSIQGHRESRKGCEPFVQVIVVPRGDECDSSKVCASDIARVDKGQVG